MRQIIYYYRKIKNLEVGLEVFNRVANMCIVKKKKTACQPSSNIIMKTDEIINTIVN